jgi:centriolar protein POC1
VLTLRQDIRLAVSGSEDKTVKLWDTHSHSVVHTYYDHLDSVNSVAFHPHGSIIAAASSDNSIKLWDVRTKTLIQHYAAADGAVRSISFHPSGDWLVSAADDSQLKVTTIQTHEWCNE